MAYVAKKPFTANQDDVVAQVTFTEATYRGLAFTGTYGMVKGFVTGGNGFGFVTVMEANGKKTRVTVAGDGVGYTVSDGEVCDTEVEESVEASRLMNYADAAEFLGISKGAVSKRAGRGSLEKVMVDGSPMIQF